MGVILFFIVFLRLYMDWAESDEFSNLIIFATLSIFSGGSKIYTESRDDRLELSESFSYYGRLNVGIFSSGG